MQENPAERTGPDLTGWRFDNGRAKRVIPPPHPVTTKGFVHAAMTAPGDEPPGHDRSPSPE